MIKLLNFTITEDEINKIIFCLWNESGNRKIKFVCKNHLKCTLYIFLIIIIKQKTHFQLLLVL